ncbi:MAG: hypothetical protein MUF56_01320 [Solirubrobacteraceae bacterium]|nr:hypothetical protein [Solirubrobacteraceae bacterium]
MRSAIVVVSLFALCGSASVRAGSPSAPAASGHGPLSIEQRLDARRAIEAVYWAHRTWPAENPRPKPPLSEILDDGALRARLAYETRREDELARACGRRIAPAMLQAELDRIARATRRPSMLAALFDALGRDARLVAECLVRPVLVERLLDACRAPAATPATGELASTDRDAEVTLPFVLPVLRAPDEPCVDDTWLGPTEVEPQARSHHTAVWTGTEMIVWGGLYGGGAEFGASGTYPLDSGGRYDPALDAWTPTSAAGAPSPRGEHAAVWTGTAMIVWGGHDPRAGASFGDGARYDPVSDAWSPLAAAGAPSARFRHTAVWTGTRMIAWGGVGATGALRTGALYDPAGDAWTDVSQAGAPSARSWHTAVWTGSEMVVWGGSDDGSGGRYAPASDTWRPVATTDAPKGRYQHAATWSTPASGMLVFGGIDAYGHEVATGARYDPVTDAWHPIRRSGMERRVHTVTWTGTEMVVFGGRAGIDTSFTDPRAYDPVTDAWRALPEAGIGSRRSHSAVFTGTEVIVWGGLHEEIGLEGFREYSDGAAYAPAADAWRAVRTSGAPALRSLHSAVWTGAEMIVWGGENPGAANPRCCLADGARYDPALDAWVRLPASALSARRRHTAVWTGRWMIVWGGDGDARYGDGARYDPATNAWSAIPSAGAPSGRTEHTAVWTGAEMIVWGGRDDSGNLAGGGRYDPAAQVWIELPAAGGPAPRRAHTAVWSGRAMLVWGGRDDAGPLASGGAFDPASGWTPMSAGGAPEARSNHVAVFTGTEMIVWGGFGAVTASFATGGRYDPVRDTWAATTTLDAPAARTRTTAAWTGTEMIVWGGAATGWDPAPPLAGGGRYAPSADRWRPMSEVAGPLARRDHGVVFTGEEVILWSGEGGGSSGGRYCASCAWARRYRDGDGDGRGDPADAVEGCGGDPAEVPDGTDCDDDDPGVFAIPGEVRDVRFASDHATLCFTSAAPDAGSATAHDVFRETCLPAPVGAAPDGTCVAEGEPGTEVVDATVPTPAAALLWLVRGRNACGAGSWGRDSTGTGREPGACP